RVRGASARCSSSISIRRGCRRRAMSGKRLLAWLTLLVAWQAHAQVADPRPTLMQVQGLGPLEAEFHPDPWSFHLCSTLLGWRITGQRQTMLALEDGYPDGQQAGPGRIALFIRNTTGQWVRSGSIDPPKGQTFAEAHMALFNEFALFQSLQGGGALFYRRSSGKWHLVQRLTPPAGYRFTEVALASGWAFIGAVSANAGAVYVYQVTATGTLKGVQTLRSYSGNAQDGFGAHLAVFGDRLVVSAAGDSNERGAAYVFER